MKYRDLAAVEDIDRDEMSRIRGGISFGKFVSQQVVEAGVGRARLPQVQEHIAEFGVTNLGQFLLVVADLTSYLGNNAIKFGAELDVPPGLPPG